MQTIWIAEEEEVHLLAELNLQKPKKKKNNNLIFLEWHFEILCSLMKWSSSMRLSQSISGRISDINWTIHRSVVIFRMMFDNVIDFLFVFLLLWPSANALNHFFPHSFIRTICSYQFGARTLIYYAMVVRKMPQQ